MGRRRDPRIADRGVVSVLSVFFVLLLLTFLAVSINLGRLVRTRGDLQHAADSAVLAATESLDVKPAGGPLAGRTSADYDKLTAGSMPDVAARVAQAYTMMSSFDQTPTIDGTLDPSSGLTYGFWHLRPAAEHCVFSTGTSCGPGWEAAPASPPGNAIHMFSVDAILFNGKYPLPPYFGSFLGVSNTNMTARATAYGRRTKVPCALPTAVSVCQLVDFWGPGTGFTCTPGVIHRTFVNNETTDPNAFGRVDLIDQWDPIGQALMRPYIRQRDFRHCLLDSADSPPTTEYLSGDGMMPGETDGIPRGNIQPVVDALVGIETEGGGQQAGRCLLGKTLVVPVVQPIGVETLANCAIGLSSTTTCPAGPPPPGPGIPPPVPSPCIPWPATGVQRVVGFVNIKFTTIHCAAPPGGGPQPVLTEANCETNPTVWANKCSAPLNAPWAEQGVITVEADITCGPPSDPLDATGTPIPNQVFKPRLVR